MKRTLISTLRWLTVLPCAIIASCVAYLFFKYAQTFFVDENSKYAIYVVPVVASLISGVALVYAGVWCAPDFKKQTALVLLVLYCLIMGYGTVLKMIDREYLDFARYVASIVGVVIGYVVPNEETV